MEKRILASGLIFLAVAGVVPGQDGAAPDVALVVVASAGRSPLHSFINSSLALELARSGFHTTPVASEGSPLVFEDARALARIAAGVSAPLTLAAAYAVRGSEIEVSLKAVEAQEARVLSSTVRTARIDLALDETLFSAVRHVVLAMVPARDRGRERAAAAATPAAAPEPVAAAAPALPPTAEPAPARGPTVSVRPPPTRGAEVAFGVAPLLPAGNLAVFIGTGVVVSAHAELHRRRADEALGIGLGTGASLFRAEGPLGAAGGLLVPMTLEGRYAGRAAGGVGFYARAGAGAALFALNSESAGVLRKVVPCALAALGLTRRIGERMGVALDATYTVYFESGDLIMGLAPGLQVFFSR